MIAGEIVSAGLAGQCDALGALWPAYRSVLAGRPGEPGSGDCTLECPQHGFGPGGGMPCR